MTDVALDAAVDAGGFTGSTSRSWSHTVSSGTDRALYVAACFWNSGGSVSSVTYGGVALTRVVQSALSASSDRVEIWRLLNPTVGTATVAVTFSASADGETASNSFFFVNQTTPERNSGSSVQTSNNNASQTATSVTAGDAILDAVAWDDRSSTITMTAVTNRVERFHTSQVAGEGGAGSTVIPGAAGSTTLPWFASPARVWALAYVVIANDTAGAFDPTTVPMVQPQAFAPGSTVVGF